MRYIERAFWWSWGCCWHHCRERAPNNIRRPTLGPRSRRLTRVQRNRRCTLVQRSRRLTLVPDTADQPARHRRYSRKRSRRRPGPRWCGHRAIGTGPAVGCGRRAAMSPDPMLMPFGFLVSGAHDTAAGSGSRDIGGARLRTARTGRRLHGHRTRPRADVQHRHTPALARATAARPHLGRLGRGGGRRASRRRPPAGHQLRESSRRDPRDRALRAYRFV